MSDLAQTDFILGTAGHIDHGKSSLIQALTGTDPDRLAEEKRRGITIELGFARLVLPDKTTMGVVDVPGHERFVRQMIAGATGIDVALLCIAADDGIMAQTVEHIAVLELLKIPALVVALTKIDMVDEEWRDFIIGEVHEYLSTTAYADASIVAVSSRTGEGLDNLMDELSRAAHSIHRTKKANGTRLPIDRVFSIKGAGTVVTGTLWSGTVSTGDEVEILPRHVRTRVRSIQAHGQTVESVHAGCRTALNLNAVSTAQLHPGDFLITPGLMSPTDRFNANLHYMGMFDNRTGKFDTHARPLKSGTRVHVAHGTREVTGRVILMDSLASVPAGAHAFAQIRLDEPLAVLWRDVFIIRSYSPVHVIGGGTVLHAHPRRATNLTKADRALLEALSDGDDTAVARAAFALSSLPVTAPDLARLSGLDEHISYRELEALVACGEAVRLQGAQTYFVHESDLQKYCSNIENALLKFHAQNPSLTGISKDALRRGFAPGIDAASFDALLAHAVSSKAAVISKGFVSHPKAGAGAREQEKQAAEKLYDVLHRAFSAPPTIAELAAATKIDLPLAHKALGILEQRGLIRRINRDFYFDAEALHAFETAVRTCLAHGPKTAAELRDAMGTTRKYAIPLLEYFDNNAITRREGNVRVLNKAPKG